MYSNFLEKSFISVAMWRFCETQTIRLGGVNVSFTARKRIV